MAATARIDELRHRYAAQPRRYLAPLANALRQSGALEEAVTMLRAQLAEYPEHLTGHVVLGQALFDTGALADARGAFESARALDPGNRVVLRYLGEIASLGGDQAAARRWFGRLRAADPYADDVAAQLGGGASEPPDADDDGGGAGITIADAGQEVREAPRTDVFERLEFDPASVDSSATPAAVPRPDPAALDPVVGLDLAPAAAPPELEAASGAAASAQPSPPDAVPAGAVDEPARDASSLGAFERITAGPFATETMAGLLAAQGHTDQAIALYERLTVERPGDAELRRRLDALRAAPAAVDSAPVDDGERAPSSVTDAARGALLAAAFADVTIDRVSSEAASAAAERAVDPERETPAAGTRSADALVSEHDADLARFDQWLRDAAA